MDYSSENVNGELSRFDIPQFDDDIDIAVMQICDILHNCAMASMSVPAMDNTVSRWERLLSDTHDRRMWQARQV